MKSIPIPVAEKWDMRAAQLLAIVPALLMFYYAFTRLFNDPIVVDIKARMVVPIETLSKTQRILLMASHQGAYSVIVAVIVWGFSSVLLLFLIMLPRLFSFLKSCMKAQKAE